MKLAPIPAISLFLLCGCAAMAQTAVNGSSENAYAAGTQAMNEQRWPDAVHDFDHVIQSHSGQTDAALYWKAYSLNRLSRGNEARTTCDVLHARFPGSSWNKDCAALTIAREPGPKRDAVPKVSRSGDGTPASEKGGDDDLKLLALNSMAGHDPARAMPILRQMLTSKPSPKTEYQAIFVLTQSRAPDARALLLDIITGKLGTDLQTRAIPEVGALEGSQWGDQFVQVYGTASDPAVKRAVISALFVSGDPTRLVALARGETNVDMKRAIVSELALMDNKVAQDYMLELLK